MGTGIKARRWASGWMGRGRAPEGPSGQGRRGSGDESNSNGCADMWSMACVLWTALDRPEPMKDRSKQGRAWARKAEELMAANPGQMAKDISIYKLGWSMKM